MKENSRMPRVDLIVAMIVGLSGIAPMVMAEESACRPDSWRDTNWISADLGKHTSVWTGSDVLVFGGENLSTGTLASGGGSAYRPADRGTWKAWTPLPSEDAPAPRRGHAAVWTGTRMIVWGGRDDAGLLATGGVYDPVSRLWRPTSTVGAPEVGVFVAAWTGSRMIVFGRSTAGSEMAGGLYDPEQDRWFPLSSSGAPRLESLVSVWTGSRLIVYGWGYDCPASGPSSPCLEVANDGGLYDPLTDSWATVTVPDGLLPEVDGQTAVWTGSRMIAWGGRRQSDGVPVSLGAIYDPASDGWTRTSDENAPGFYDGYHTAVWTGSEMIAYGMRYNYGGASGAIYQPGSDTWRPLPAHDEYTDTGYSAVFTGQEMVAISQDVREYVVVCPHVPPIARCHDAQVWADETGTAVVAPELVDAGSYDPETAWNVTLDLAPDGPYPMGTTPVTLTVVDSDGTASTCTAQILVSDCTNGAWRTINPGELGDRIGHTAVWTGDRMIVWGGAEIVPPWFEYASRNTGALYDPRSDTWIPTGIDGAPSPRAGHSAVWTGSRMIVWGGTGEDGAALNSGGIYDPATSTWTEVQPAPLALSGHFAAWTGTTMIVWGPTGGSRYDPTTDTWLPLSTQGAPQIDRVTGIAWSGSEMIVNGTLRVDCWFEPDCPPDGYRTVKDGGSYDPESDGWRRISLTGAPFAYHSVAVWADDRMIETGGYSEGRYGGLSANASEYHPVTDRWTDIGPFEGRAFHTSVWTGDRMIVWGGYMGRPGGEVRNDGASYDPASTDGAWTILPLEGAPTARQAHTAVFTGTEMLIWGGSVADFQRSTLVRDAAAYTVACESRGTPPVARCKDVETTADATCKASVEPSAVDAGSLDEEDGVDLMRSLDPAGPFSLGTTPVTLTVTDSDDMSGTCEANVVVSDETAPTLSDAVASPAVLFPANHKWRVVEVRYDANDNCSLDELACSLSVTSNEPVSVRWSDPSPDWMVIDEHEVWLRAQRLGTGDGRVYTITIRCTDAGGNSSTRETTVEVPRGLVIDRTDPPIADNS